MELREHLKIIKKAQWFIIIFALCAAMAAFLFTYLQPEKYKVSIGFDINMVNRPIDADYQYGSYYDLKGAEIFSQNVISWFLTPPFVAEIYQKSDIPFEIDSFSGFTNRFKAKQYSAQNVVVTYSDVYEPNAKKLADGIIEVVKEKTKAAEIDVEGRNQWEAVNAEPIIVLTKNPYWLTALLGLIAGFVVGVLLVYLKYYIKENK